MKTFHFFVQIISFSLCFVSVAMVYAVFLKYRLEAIRKYAYFLIFFTLFYFMMLVIYYYDILLMEAGSQFIFYYTGFCAAGFLIYSAASVVFEFLSLPFGRSFRFIFITLSAVPAIWTTVYALFFRPLMSLKEYLNWHHGYIFAVFVLELGFLGWLILSRIKSADHPGKKRFMKIAVILIVSYFPFFIADVLSDFYFQNFHNHNFGTYFYLVWNCFNILISVHYLASTPGELLSLTVEPGEAFIRKYAITDRECEIIRMIARGIGNKEIASQLYLSLSTVRNHIYNIFKKTGVKTRIELLNRLNLEK